MNNAVTRKLVRHTINITWKGAFKLGAKIAVAKCGFDLVDTVIYAVSKEVLKKLKKMEKASQEEAKDE